MKSCGCAGTLPCGCCAGSEAVTPESEFNRPGLSALRYRAGTHATFLETMLASLAKDRRLDALATRKSSDASIAFLDAWATVGHVLTFYQERIANEGYLATATERRSVHELANLVGYRPRPGVSASVFVAYTLDKGARGPIPPASLIRSVPGPDEDQQTFETAEPLFADAAWNNLQVRLTSPPTTKAIMAAQALYLKGVVTSVQKGDPLLIQFPEKTVLCRIVEVTPDAAAGRTRVGLEEWSKLGNFRTEAGTQAADQLRPLLRIEDFGLTMTNATVKLLLPVLEKQISELEAGVRTDTTAASEEIRKLLLDNPPRSQKARKWADALLFVQSAGRSDGPEVSVDDIAQSGGLLTAPSVAPRSQYHRPNDIQALFGVSKNEKPLPTHVAGSVLSTLTAFRPKFRGSLATALANARVTANPDIRVFSVTRTAAFGNLAIPRAETTREGIITTSWHEWDLESPQDIDDSPFRDQIHLEKEFDKVDVNSIVAIQEGTASYRVAELKEVTTVSRAAYGLSGKVTKLKFSGDVLKGTGGDLDRTLSLLRPVKVFLSADRLELAEQPITNSVCGFDAEIELDGMYEGLEPGRWIVISGEREDTPGTSGVQATELLLIGDVQHRAARDLRGDRMHTFLTVVRQALTGSGSSYCYKRESVKIYGNVVKATHGETREEYLGSGNAAQPFQQFALKQAQLTYLPAATASGAESTLKTYVNDVKWHEAASLLGLAAYERRFATRTSEDGTTTVLFGDGINGSRLPTGMGNVRAVYRNGIGKGGNVQTGQLSLLGSKPPGVKEVINPLRASGGADRDSRDKIRENAPLSITALDRLVSVADYAHFARVFAGIGKASATSLSDGHRQLVHITIAGADDIPIDATSDLYANLRHALHLWGDPNQPLQVDVRAAKFLVLQANVKLHPDYLWEVVAPQLEAALREAFSFERRQLGQNAYLSQVLDVMQRIPGVEYVDADKFGALTESQLSPDGIRKEMEKLKLATAVTAKLAQPGPNGIAPAEIAYFAPNVSATIALNRL